MRPGVKATTIQVVASILALIVCILVAAVFAIGVAAVVWVFRLDGAR